jgi:hypothetical protein
MPNEATNNAFVCDIAPYQNAVWPAAIGLQDQFVIAAQTFARDYGNVGNAASDRELGICLRNYPPPLIAQAVTAPRMVWNGVFPLSLAVSTVVRRAASASAAHLAR